MSRLILVGSATFVAAAIVRMTPGDAPRIHATAAVMFYGGLALVWNLAGGWLGRELGSGTAVLWSQFPSSPVATYGCRYVATLAMALGLAGIQAGVIAALLFRGVAPGAYAPLFLAGLPGTLLVYLVFGALVWAVGGWGVPGDGWAALLAAVGLSVLELAARLRPNWLGPVAPIADVVGVPLDDLGLATAFLTGHGGSLQAVLRLLAWLAGCGMVGAMGVRATFGRAPHSDPL